MHLEREMTEPVRIVQEFGAIENEAQSWSILAAESNARCTICLGEGVHRRVCYEVLTP